MTSGPVALVTGASRGIGRGIAVALGAAGWSVGVNYCGNAAAATETVSLVEQAGAAAVAVQGDVGVEDDRRRMVEEVEAKLGPIDLLVNNAGITSVGRADMMEAGEEGYDRVMRTNLKGPWFLTQRVAKRMAERGATPEGRFRGIVFVTSISAEAVSTNRGDYCLTKAALGMATQLWAARMAEFGVNVYEVRPGIIQSDMTAGEAVKAKYDRLIGEGGLLPIARWGTAQDVGRAVAMLASGALGYSTGQVIRVDGGFGVRRL